MQQLTRTPQILFILIALTVIQFGCTGNEKKIVNSIDTTANKSLIITQDRELDTAKCDYYITETDGRAMIQKFTSTYPSLVGSVPGHLLTPDFWIDSCVLSSLVNFFNTTGSQCDGVRFHFIGDKKSRLIIVPTSAVMAPSATFKHTDRPDLIITSLCNSPVPAQYLNMSADDIRTGKGEFGVSFRREEEGGGMSTAQIDQLSASVWYSKCIIKTIAKLVLDKSNNLNGIIAFGAAHLKMEAAALGLGQRYENQSTLIFVPTRDSDHKPAWDIVTPPPSIDLSHYKTTSGAFNHGSLCPQICN